MTVEPEVIAEAPRGPEISTWERMVRIFASPSSAWEGLGHRARFWIPLVLLLVVNAVLSAATYHRVLVPMMLDQWDEAVVSGQMQADQVAKISEFFTHNPAAIAITVGQQAIILPVVMLFVALVVWFGCGFVLGTRFRYRLALEVVCWSSLVRLPETLITYGIGWFTQTFKGIHLGLAALLPEPEVATKFHTGLAVFLDALGPFGIWYLAVSILGASALSGAPRKNVAWVLGALYVALAALLAAVAGAFSPGA